MAIEANPQDFANGVRALLMEDPRRYRNFGVYWYFVKALLRRYFDRHQMPMLGDYEDPDVIARMPELDASIALSHVAAEYRQNATFNFGRNRVVDTEGEAFTLIDPDMEG